jgi:hypothetical protein
MPLRDHFHPPLSECHFWDGVHAAWATCIAQMLNRELLPEEYMAIPQVTPGGRVEIDVATMRTGEAPHSGNGSLAVALWSAPTMTAPVDFAPLSGYSVQVVRQLGGQQLRGAIELVSPANKDRAANRRAFAIKIANYLQRNVGVIVVNVVTERKADLHSELIDVLRLDANLLRRPKSDLSAVAYRINPGSSPVLEVWANTLNLGEVLPTLPLRLEEDLTIGVDIEQSYEAASASVRIR